MQRGMVRTGCLTDGRSGDSDGDGCFSRCRKRTRKGRDMLAWNSNSSAGCGRRKGRRRSLRHIETLLARLFFKETTNHSKTMEAPWALNLALGGCVIPSLELFIYGNRSILLPSCHTLTNNPSRALDEPSPPCSSFFAYICFLSHFMVVRSSRWEDGQSWR